MVTAAEAARNYEATASASALADALYGLKGALGSDVERPAAVRGDVYADGIPRAWYRARRRTPYEVLRERYVVGFYTLADFERFVVRLIECGDA